MFGLANFYSSALAPLPENGDFITLLSKTFQFEQNSV
jgi:hypothetical protein